MTLWRMLMSRTQVCKLTNSKILSEKNTHNFLYFFIQVQYEHPVIQCLVDVMTDLAFMAELVKRVGIGKFIENLPSLYSNFGLEECLIPVITKYTKFADQIFRF